MVLNLVDEEEKNTVTVCDGNKEIILYTDM